MPDIIRRNRLLLGLIIVAIVVIIVALIFAGRPLEEREETAINLAELPTRTSTPTETALPPTATATATATSVPPTETPVTPTEEPTATRTPTETPIPATATSVPPQPTAAPPSPTPAPVTVLSSVDVPNLEGDEGQIMIRYGDDDWATTDSPIYADGDDGHRYRIDFGFWSRSESVSTVRDYWSWAQRGGGSWQMIVRLRTEIEGWAACTSEDAVCSSTHDNPNQMMINVDLYLKQHAWESLLNDYLAGGWQATTQNAHYGTIQEKVFRPIIDIDPPQEPCVGFAFTRVD